MAPGGRGGAGWGEVLVCVLGGGIGVCVLGEVLVCV